MNLSDFDITGGARKTLIVLGAGASRGASFVQDETLPLPPLDRDFFQQLARMPDSSDTRHLLEFVRSEYRHEVGLSMEKFFSEADYTDRFHHELNVDRGRSVRRYKKALGHFLAVLPAMLNQTTSQSCAHHDLLATLLHAGDCVLSFNYDCIMDRALRDNANRRWDPELSGYGFQVASGGLSWKKHSARRPVQTSIRLLKLHGSLNWRVQSTGKVALVADTKSVQSLRGAIIPPTWFKNLTTFPFSDIWKAARREVRTARVMVVIGYSVPDTDLFSRSLFKVEAGSKEKREKLDLLVLVNPDDAARKRFLEIIRDGLEPSTRIREYDSLKQLAALFQRSQVQTASATLHAAPGAVSVQGHAPTVSVARTRP